MKTRRFMYGLAATLFSTVALQSYAALISVESKVLEVWIRDWGMHVLLEPTVQIAGLQCTGGNVRAPLISLTDPKYKTAKDTLLLAYTLKSKVRFFFDTTTPCFGSEYPYLFAVDALALP
jgi:hypothetical protein